MNRFFLVLFFLLIVSSCSREKDPVVAEVYNTRLYASEVGTLIPKGLNRSDSLQMADYLIDEWIKRQILLHEAEKTLSVREKKFEKEILQFREDLLRNAYYKKLTADSSIFDISEKELSEFMHEFDFEVGKERGIVKLNYVKLSPSSKVLSEVRSILFDDQLRVTEKTRIELLCGDSLEYFVDDHTWLYFDDFKKDVPVDLSEEELSVTPKNNMEKRIGNFIYLISFLEYKKTPDQRDEEELRDMAKSMLIQQKRTQYINNKIDELYQQALKDKKIAR